MLNPDQVIRQNRREKQFHSLLHNVWFVRFTSVLAFSLSVVLFMMMQRYNSGGYSLLVVILAALVNFIFSFSKNAEIKEVVHVLTFILYLGILYAGGICTFFFLVINA